jgi:hypothetical protein
VCRQDWDRATGRPELSESWQCQTQKGNFRDERPISPRLQDGTGLSKKSFYQAGFYIAGTKSSAGAATGPSLSETERYFLRRPLDWQDDVKWLLSTGHEKFDKIASKEQIVHQWQTIVQRYSNRKHIKLVDRLAASQGI